MGEMRNTYKFLVRKPEGKRLLNLNCMENGDLNPSCRAAGWVDSLQFSDAWPAGLHIRYDISLIKVMEM
jgi:hypothetical protein